ncbi:hypothetical protein; putative signal sequence [Bradyrhizobium sp. ORS 278]|uniref:hypothetical protein n=1 Tax=Bradyrhizobium sp. (strain ORS 278) TaxID=114615 RepID=UPI0001508F43|nr:hypothetical protein [Bradyrhizobium sp. ORS 278]CAL77091.1 hypothetical protein; putative signal sequence [Bradyrhizobium sp. ORS 278]
MRTLIAALSIMAITTAAVAGTFGVPYEKSAFTITVPDGWSPNHSEDGVDAAAPGNTFFMSIYTFDGDNCAAARDDVVAMLTRNGMTIDRASAKESAQPLAGLQGTATQYAATEDKKARQIVALVAPLPGKRCLQVAQWGTADGFQRNAAAVTKILGSIKLTGK